MEYSGGSDVFQSNLEWLVRNSPIPQVLMNNLNQSTASQSTNQSSTSNRRLAASRYDPMSVSARPLIKPAVHQFMPFRSPQGIVNPDHRTISDIFNSLKNSAQTGDDSRNYSFKGNNVSGERYLPDPRSRHHNEDYNQVVHPGVARNNHGVEDLTENVRTFRRSNAGLLQFPSSVEHSKADNAYRSSNTVNNKRQLQHNNSYENDSNVGEFREDSMVDENISYTANRINREREIATRMQTRRSLRRAESELIESNDVGSVTDMTSQAAQADTRSLQDHSDDDAENGVDLDKLETFEGTAPVSLFNWIIKPVPGVKAICVEGKKSLSDTEFWHSGIIIRRVTEKVVVTQTGSMYKLEGNIAFLDALSAGFPHKLLEAFWLGFPADWHDLILDFFNREPVQRTEEEEEDFEDDIMVMLDEDDYHGAPEMLEATDDVSNNQVDSTLKELTGMVDSTKNKMVVKPKKKKKAKSRHGKKKSSKKAGDKKGAVVEKWVINAIPSGRGIQLLGNKTNGRFWHSTVIEKRLDKTHLETTSGSVYTLKGNMDKLLALDRGLPMEIISKFKSGFPKDWQELIQEHIYGKAKKKKAHIKTTRAAKSKSEQKTPKCDTSSSKANNKAKSKDNATASKLSGKASSKKDDNSTPKPATSKVKGSKASDKKSESTVDNSKKALNSNNNSVKKSRKPTVQEVIRPKKQVLTPGGQIVDLEALGTSRSGRLIKPPLQWWTGQKVVMDGEQCVVESPTLAAKQYLDNFEQTFYTRRNKLKSYWNPSQKDRNSSASSCNSTANQTISSITAANETLSSVTTANETITSVTSANEAEVSEQTGAPCPRVDIQVEKVLENARKNRKKRGQRSTCYTRTPSDATTKDDTGNGEYDLYDIEENDDDDQDVNTHKTRGRKSTAGNALDSNTDDNLAWTKIQFDMNDSADSEKGGTCEKRGRGRPRKSVDKCNMEETNTVTSIKRTSRNSGKHKASDTAIGVDSEARDNVLVPSTSMTQKPETGTHQHETSVNIGAASLRIRMCKTNEGEPIVTRSARSCTLRNNLSDTDRDTVESDTTVKQDNKRRSSGKSATKNKMASSTESIAASTTMSKATNKSDKSAELDEDSDYWTEEEKQRLHQARRLYDPSNNDYWDQVSELVRTKTSIECSQVIFQEYSQPRSAKGKEKSKPRATSLTANVGTLKRKQQLKDLIEQHNENYEDDIFDSTPFRLTRKRKVPVMVDDGDAMFEELAKKQGKSRYETPKGPDVAVSWVKPPLASTSKTPLSSIDSEMFNRKKDFDGYVHRLMKTRALHRGCKKKLATPAKKLNTSSKSSLVQDDTVVQALFKDYMAEKKKADMSNHVDSDQDEDYYWQDDDQGQQV